MTQEQASEFIGQVVSWHSSQDKFWNRPRQVRKLGEDLSLSDYHEVAHTHSDPGRREKFKAVAGWMDKQGAKDDTRLSALFGRGSRGPGRSPVEPAMLGLSLETTRTRKGL